MQAPELAVEEMKRAAIDLKMPGFQIGSHVGDWNLDAKELYPIYKTAEELGNITSVSGSDVLFMKFYVKPKMTVLLRFYFDFTEKIILFRHGTICSSMGNANGWTTI